MNGQHNVNASKMLIEMDPYESILKQFLEWDSYIFLVWQQQNTKDHIGLL